MPRNVGALTIQTEMIQFYFRSGLTISEISDGRNGATQKIKRLEP